LAPSHHGQEHSIGTKAAIAERSQLALVAGIVQLRPPEPPAAEHWPADTAEQTAEDCLASGTKNDGNHRPLG